MKLAIQGAEGSYHEQAAQHYMRGCDVLYKDTFADVFRSVDDETCDGAIVAIANNAVGYIHEPYKTLVRDTGTYFIAGETYVRVEHQLLGLSGTQLRDITHIHSQAPALGQCEGYLQSELPHAHLEEEQDTALSARFVARLNDYSHAAIASRHAGEIYGLVPIAENIQDDPHNITRFLHIVKRSTQQRIKGANKLTAIMTTPGKPNSLASALSLFGNRQIGLSSIQSLFIPNTPFRMQFWLDANVGQDDERFSEISRGLGELGCEFTVLGSYIEEEVPLLAR